MKARRISTSYDHAYKNVGIRQKCRFFKRPLFLFLFCFVLFCFIFFSLNYKKCRKSWKVLFFLCHIFFEAPKNKRIIWACISKCWNKTKVTLFKRPLFFFHPIMISVENVEKCWFYATFFFSLKPWRISASYEQAYRNAEMRQKCWFLRGLYFFFAKSWLVPKMVKSAVFYATFSKPRRISASYENAYKYAEIRQKCRFLWGLYFFRPYAIMISAENVEKCWFVCASFLFLWSPKE